MCRFMVYKGRYDILLSKLITEPTHSILHQSYDSRLRLVSSYKQLNASPHHHTNYCYARTPGAPSTATVSA